MTDKFKASGMWLLVFGSLMMFVQYKSNDESISDVTRYLYDGVVNNAPIMVVKSSECRNEALWGRRDHGGWYVCLDSLPDPTSSTSESLSLSKSKCIVYSFGLGADWSFDNEAEKYGCNVHGFDPSNTLWQQGMHGEEFSKFDYARQYPSSLKHFHNWGLGALPNVEYPPGTFPQDWPGLGDPPFSKALDIEDIVFDIFGSSLE